MPKQLIFKPLNCIYKFFKKVSKIITESLDNWYSFLVHLAKLGVDIMKIGYKRVSTENQKLDRQTDLLNEFGVERIFEEKVTGTKRERNELNKMLDMLREGDIVVVADLTRLSRSTKDLFEIVEIIHSKGAEIKSLKENWLDTTTPQGKLLFTMFARFKSI